MYRVSSESTMDAPLRPPAKSEKTQLCTETSSACFRFFFSRIWGEKVKISTCSTCQLFTQQQISPTIRNIQPNKVIFDFSTVTASLSQTTPRFLCVDKVFFPVYSWYSWSILCTVKQNTFLSVKFLKFVYVWVENKSLLLPLILLYAYTWAISVLHGVLF